MYDAYQIFDNDLFEMPDFHNNAVNVGVFNK